MAEGTKEIVADEGEEVAINENTIKNLIYVIRGQQVMLDSDLAMLYQVETKVLNQAVKRNILRFPEAFRFQMRKEVVYRECLLKVEDVLANRGIDKSIIEAIRGIRP